jgi:hypothetical protein
MSWPLVHVHRALRDLLWLISYLLCRDHSKMSSSKKLTCTVNGLCGRCLFRVYRLEIQSVTLEFSFRRSFVNCCPTNLLSGSTPPPPAPFPLSILCWSLTVYIWTDSEPTKLLDHAQQKPRRGGGLRQINTCCRKVSFKVNFFR